MRPSYIGPWRFANPRTLRVGGPDCACERAGASPIDLGALADNWRELARRAAPGRCAAVVKANAYGIGLSEAAPALWAAGARVFFVAHLSEGIAARRALPAEAQIYVLNGLESGAEPADYAEHRLAPVIGGDAELRALVRLRRSTWPDPRLARSISTPA